MRRSSAALAVAAATLVAAWPSTARAAGQDAYVLPFTRVADGGALLRDEAAWEAIKPVELSWDFQYARAARDTTKVRVAVDPRYLYVAFEAQQRVPVSALQQTNAIGVDTDDQVEVVLWPGGPNGFRYSFIATPVGTRYESSTENAGYAPRWDAVGVTRAGGFVVRMRIPLSAVHGTERVWRVQLVRVVRATKEQYLWAHASGQADPYDVVYAGLAPGLAPRTAHEGRRGARVGVYALGSADPAAGTRATGGVDFSVPLQRTISFFGTLHPDFTDVEADQQTISPTAFARAYTEVRPFFAQGASLYNRFGYGSSPECWMCQPPVDLYTPAIPTPQQGFALEGTRGRFDFAAFEARGAGRTDDAVSVHYANPARTVNFEVQRVGVDVRPLHDVVTTWGATFDDHRHNALYVDAGADAGTQAGGLDARRFDANYKAYGRTWYTALGWHRAGAGYQPADGYVPHADINGYDLSAARSFNFSPAAPLQNVTLQAEVDRYRSLAGVPNQSDNAVSLEVTTRNQIRGQITSGSDYLLLPNGVYAPVQQNGIAFNYRRGTALPQGIAYNQGRFGDGLLRSWARYATVRVGARGTLQVRADDTQQFLDSGTTYTQWLERATYTQLLSSESALTVGLRRIIGYAPQLAAPPAPLNAWNLSAAFHRRVGRSEFYIVYGDPSTVTGSHAVILKVVQYVGADKGV